MIWCREESVSIALFSFLPALMSPFFFFFFGFLLVFAEAEILAVSRQSLEKDIRDS